MRKNTVVRFHREMLKRRCSPDDCSWDRGKRNHGTNLEMGKRSKPQSAEDLHEIVPSTHKHSRKSLYNSEQGITVQNLRVWPLLKNRITKQPLTNHEEFQVRSSHQGLPTARLCWWEPNASSEFAESGKNAQWLWEAFTTLGAWISTHLHWTFKSSKKKFSYMDASTFYMSICPCLSLHPSSLKSIIHERFTLILPLSSSMIPLTSLHKPSFYCLWYQTM